MFLLTILPIVGHAQTIFFSDNFECNCWSNWSWNPVVAGGNPDAALVNDSSNYSGTSSGTLSAQQTYRAGWTDSGGLGWQNLGKAQLPSSFLVEYDFKLSPNFHFPLGQKMWRTMPDMNTGAGPNDTVANMQMNDYGTSLAFEVFSYSTSFGVQEFIMHIPVSKISVNTWHRLGFRFKKNTFSGSFPNSDGQIELFFDGVSIGSRSDVRLAADSTRWFRDYSGGPLNYTSVTDNNPIPQDQWIRIDNFRITNLTGVSTSPPPPSSPPPTSPPPPASDTTPPPMPGTPSITLASTDATSARFSVSWTASIDQPSNAAVPTYAYSAGYGDGTGLQSGSVNTTSLTLVMPYHSSGTSQSGFFCVTAVDAAGNRSIDSACNIVLVPAPPVASPPPPPAPAPTPTSTPPPSGLRECDNWQSAHPGWIWCDDFEVNRLASYFEYDNSAGDFVPMSGLGVNSSTAMRAIYRPGQSSAGGIRLAFGSTPHPYFRAVDAGTAKYREVYWRMYVKNQSGWTGGGAGKLSRAIVFANSNWAEAAIGHVWSGSSPGPTQDYLFLDPSSGTDAAGNLLTTTYNDFAHLRWLGAQQGTTPLFNSANVGQWHCVETHMKLNDAGQSNGLFELWVDGNLNARSTGLNWLGSYSTFGLNAIFFENYWNETSPVVQERYFDNIVVSTVPIGCGSLTTAGLPAAPTGLVVSPYP